VVLIDADMRRPRLHEILQVDNARGLSDLLRERDSIEEYPIEALAKETRVPNLFVLPSGPSSLSIANLLYSPRMAELLARFRREFDCVLIDTPPMLQISDARVLGALVDGVILVVQPGRSPIDEAQATLTQMNTAGARMLGVVFNRIPRNRSHYYGGYRYYNHKGYYEESRDPQKSQSVTRTSEVPQVDNMLPAPSLAVPDRSNGKSKPVVEPLKKK